MLGQHPMGGDTSSWLCRSSLQRADLLLLLLLLCLLMLLLLLRDSMLLMLLRDGMLGHSFGNL